MPLRRRVVSVAATLALASGAGADVAYNNFGPGDTFSGNGWIVYGPSAGALWWTHAFQFTSTASGGITNLVVPVQWLGNENDFSLELRADEGGMPGAVLGSFDHFVGNNGTFTPPVQIAADGTVQIAAGTTYWLVCKGYGSTRGTWHASLDTNGLRAYSFDGGSTWTLGSVTISAFRVEVSGGPAPCYANCDGSTTAPVLNVLDFNCFLNAFSAGASYANCDGSTTAPVLNVLDFNCFLNRFSAGCP